MAHTLGTMARDESHREAAVAKRERDVAQREAALGDR